MTPNTPTSIQGAETAGFDSSIARIVDSIKAHPSFGELTPGDPAGRLPVLEKHFL